MATGIPARLTAAEGRKFACTVGGAFAVLGAVAWWRARQIPMYTFGSLAGVFVLAGLVMPTALGPLQRAWMAGAHQISRVTTPIFMGVVYYVILTPIGLGMRLAGRNPIRQRAVNGSYWAARNGARSEMTNQF